MQRRVVLQSLLATLSSVALIDTALRRGLLAAPARMAVSPWLARLDELCRDLRTAALEPTQWQDQIAALHAQLGVDDVARLLDLERVAAGFTYPELGVVTHDPALPAVAGVAKRSYIARIFGMSKGRAIIPHGHRNMASSHRVIGGAFHLRQYDRHADDGDFVIVRPTRDETAKLGSSSSISSQRDNVHWLVATSPRAFTFDVIVTDLGGAKTEIDNLDMAAATRASKDALRVRKLDVDAALAKYGKS